MLFLPCILSRPNLVSRFPCLPPWLRGANRQHLAHGLRFTQSHIRWDHCRGTCQNSDLEGAAPQHILATLAFPNYSSAGRCIDCLDLRQERLSSRDARKKLGIVGIRPSCAALHRAILDYIYEVLSRLLSFPLVY